MGNQTTEEKPVREPEVATMTLEEFRAQKKSVNRNPNAKANDDDDVKETKKDHEAKRKGRAGRMAPVDFRPAPLVAPRGGGDRRGGERKYNKNDSLVPIQFNLTLPTWTKQTTPTLVKRLI